MELQSSVRRIKGVRVTVGAALAALGLAGLAIAGSRMELAPTRARPGPWSSSS